ncbi:hypothetical protein EJB05_54385, partial [Eragrostis curvula]
MARAFHAAAAASPAAVASPSPLPSKTTGAWGSTGGIANLQWLLRKRASKVRHGGGMSPLGQEPPEDEGNYDDDDEAASMFAGATPYYDAAATPCRRRHGEAAVTRLRAAILAVVARARRGGKGKSSSPLGSRSPKKFRYGAECGHNRAIRARKAEHNSDKNQLHHAEPEKLQIE